MRRFMTGKRRETTTAMHYVRSVLRVKLDTTRTDTKKLFIFKITLSLYRPESPKHCTPNRLRLLFQSQN